MVGIVGRRKSHDANDICGGPPEVSTTICVDDVFTLAQGALRVN